MKHSDIIGRFAVGLLISGSLVSAGAAVALQDNVTDEGRSCYKITTASATYYYDKNGGGFTSLVDKNGKDWINWHASPCGSQAGCYRGIPNMAIGFHPGYPDIGGSPGCASTIVSQSASKVTIQSTTTNGSRNQWDFYDSHATMTLISATGQYYVLYEGTPGGTDGLTADGFYYASDHIRHGILEKLNGGGAQKVLPDPEWICFSGGGLRRSILLIHQNHDNILDNYWPMYGVGNGNMTVFGFGRTGDGASPGMSATNNVFHVALVEDTSVAVVSAAAQGIMHPTAIAGGPGFAASPANRAVMIENQGRGTMSLVGPDGKRFDAAMLDIEGRAVAAASSDAHGRCKIACPRNGIRVMKVSGENGTITHILTH